MPNPTSTRAALVALTIATAALLAQPSTAAAASPPAGQPGGPCSFTERTTHLGTNGDDVISGTPGPDYIFALGGDDTIRGLGGDDTICAGPGDDLVYGGSGRDSVSVGGGSDVFFGGAGNDDVLAYGGADDHLFGGEDKDIFTLQITGDGAGVNTLGILGSKPGVPDTHLDALVVIAKGTVHNIPLVVDARSGSFRTPGSADAGTVRGIDAYTFLSAGSQNRWPLWVDYTGSDAVDDVGVGAGRLTAAGGPGDDRIFAAGGNDVIYGGPGEDAIYAGPGRDVVSGDKGHDDLSGGRGDDRLYGGLGPDALDGGPGTDTCVSGATEIRCED